MIGHLTGGRGGAFAKLSACANLKLDTVNHIKWRQPLECGRSGPLWLSSSVVQTFGTRYPSGLPFHHCHNIEVDYQSGLERPHSKGSADLIYARASNN